MLSKWLLIFNETLIDHLLLAPPVQSPHRDFDYDRQKLQEKIRNEFNNGDILEKPELQKNQIPIVPPPANPQHQLEINNKPIPSTAGSMLYSADGEESDPAVREKRNKVKEVSSHQFFYSFTQRKLAYFRILIHHHNFYTTTEVPMLQSMFKFLISVLRSLVIGIIFLLEKKKTQEIFKSKLLS